MYLEDIIACESHPLSCRAGVASLMVRSAYSRTLKVKIPHMIVCQHELHENSVVYPS